MIHNHEGTFPGTEGRPTLRMGSRCGAGWGAAGMKLISGVFERR